MKHFFSCLLKKLGGSCNVCRRLCAEVACCSFTLYMQAWAIFSSNHLQKRDSKLFIEPVRCDVRVGLIKSSEIAKISKCLSKSSETSRKRRGENLFWIKTETCSDKSYKSLIQASKTNMLLSVRAAQHLICSTEVEMKWTPSPFSYHASIDFSSLRCFPLPLATPL